MDEQILESCTTYLEDLLEVPAGKVALDKFLADSHFSSVLLNPPISGDVKSSPLHNHVIKFFIRLFQLGKCCFGLVYVIVANIGQVVKATSSEHFTL